jgi:thiol-disulfide isomerase/thioredoxin
MNNRYGLQINGNGNQLRNSNHQPQRDIFIISFILWVSIFLHGLLLGAPSAFFHPSNSSIPAFRKEVPLMEGSTLSTLTIHLHGVETYKISLLSSQTPQHALYSQIPIRSGEELVLEVQSIFIPGEFILIFEPENPIDQASKKIEKTIFFGHQSIDFYVDPLLLEDPKNSYFGKTEKENACYQIFFSEAAKQKERLALLQNMVLNYDLRGTRYFKKSVKEFEKQRHRFNRWIAQQINIHKDLYVSHCFSLEFLPEIVPTNSYQEQVEELTRRYFDRVDFHDSLLPTFSRFKKFINDYLSFYSSRATDKTLGDSLFTLAGHRIIEKASTGHPKNYGWVVDYFYMGYESYGIQPGLAMLEKHIQNPACWTKKKQQIQKRLTGMQQMTKGSIAPNFTVKTTLNDTLDLYDYSQQSDYTLVLFWSANCQHCRDLANELNEWYEQNDNRSKIQIIALSMDETEPEIQQWKQQTPNFPNWMHAIIPLGINSSIANDYFLLSTPAFFVLDGVNNAIQAIPNSVMDLENCLNDLRNQ